MGPRLTKLKTPRSLHRIQLAVSLRPMRWLAGLATQGAQVSQAMPAPLCPALYISDCYKPAAVGPQACLELLLPAGH